MSQQRVAYERDVYVKFMPGLPEPSILLIPKGVSAPKTISASEGYIYSHTTWIELTLDREEYEHLSKSMLAETLRTKINELTAELNLITKE